MRGGPANPKFPRPFNFFNQIVVSNNPSVGSLVFIDSTNHLDNTKRLLTWDSVNATLSLTQDFDTASQFIIQAPNPSPANNMQEWRDYTGFAQASMYADGTLTLNNIFANGTIQPAGSIQQNTGAGILFKDDNGNDIFRWIAAVTTSRFVSLNTVSTTTAFQFEANDGTQPVDQIVKIPISNAADRGITIEGASSQTGNLIETQDSSANNLGGIDSSGYYYNKINGTQYRVAKYAPLFDHYADAGSSGTGETDLYSDSIPAGILANNGDKLTADYGCTLASTGGVTKRVKVYFGGSVIFDTGALTISSAGDICIKVVIIRDSSTTIRYAIAATTTGASTGNYAAVGKLTGLTLSNANTLKITGQSGTGAASNDVNAILGTVNLILKA